MTPFSKVLTVALAGMISLSASAFAGTPEEEAAALTKLINEGATKNQVAQFVKDKIADAANKEAMAKALIVVGKSDAGLMSRIASAAIAAAGRTGSDAEKVAAGLIAGGGAGNTKVVAAAIKLAAGPDGDATVQAAITAARALGGNAAANAVAGANSVSATLGVNLQDAAAAAAGNPASTDNTGALAEKDLTAKVLIAAAAKPTVPKKYPNNT